MRYRTSFVPLLFAGALAAACSDPKPPVTVTQITDTSEVTGIAADGPTVWCATRGGLVEWNLPKRSYTVFTTADGLPGNVLSDVVLDGKKRVWIGSDSGVAFREGPGWKRYGVSEGLPSPIVNDLAVDSDGTVWAATDKGVVFFKGGKPSFLSEKDGPGGVSATCVFFDTGKNLWIGTKDNGIYAKVQGEWRTITSRSGLILNTSRTIAQDWDNSIWSASSCGVNRYDGYGFQSFSLKQHADTFDTRMMIGTGTGIWFFTANGVHMMKGSEWIHITEAEGLASNDVLCGFAGPDGRVFAGTRYGMSVIENGLPVAYSIPDTPFGREFVFLAVDPRGRLLAGTAGSGLNILDDGVWGRLAGPSKESLATVNSVVFGPDSTLVFNTSAGLVTWRNGVWKTLTRADGIAGDDIRAGAYGTDGSYWTVTSTGVSRLKGGTWTRYRELHGLPSEDARTCVVDRAGKIWVGTARGIVSFDENELVNWTDRIGAGSDSLDIRSSETAGGSVYFGTASGKLIEYDGSSWRVSSRSSSPITFILPDPSGTIWLATDGGGVVRVDGKRSRTIAMKDGLPSDRVHALVLKDGNLIAACYGGIGVIALNAGK